ncbi:MAG: hypothetical protein JWL69_2282 [Phycisphaerales bacterium]|nr:hypothetical protein [Phycisphaerales bacterium]
MRELFVFVTSLLGLSAALAGPALAVGTSYWTQTTEADFKTGTLENVVATNLGDLKLSRAVKTLLEQDPRIGMVNALAEAPDGTIYAGTGPHGVLLAIKDEKVTTLTTLPDDSSILSIIVDKAGAIILGTGGEAGRVLKIDKPGDKPHALLEPEGVNYVWSIVQTPDGNLYAATGSGGQLFEIKPDGSKRMLLDSDENNLLCLISDGKDLLYVGTDPHGLVYRVNRKTGDSFVLYNAPESEISALALDKQGNLYAATAEAKEQPPVPEQNAADAEKNGRPEGGAVGVPIPSDRPKEPTPPPPPAPNPGRPDPIPKEPQSRAQARRLMDHRAVALLRSQRIVLPSGAVAGSGAGSKSHRDTGVPPVLSAQTNSELHSTEFEYIPHGRDARVTVTPDGAPVFFALASTSAPDAPTVRKSPGKPGPAPGPTPGPDPNPGPGKPQPGPQKPPPQTAPAEPPLHQPAVDTTIPAEPRAEGNAIYKIDPDGFVTQVFRQPVLILSMVENNGTLLVATGGSEGQIYQVRPAADETLVLAKVDAKAILCLLPARDGKVYMGMANVGSLAAMSGGFAAKGTFASPVLDATQISRFGKTHLHGALPAGTSLTLATRSGNVKDPAEKSWSKWTDEVPATEFVQVASPAARFLQYRLTFTSNEGKSSPVVEDVTTAYQIPNLPPAIKSIKIGSDAKADLASELEAAVAGTPPKKGEANQSGRHQTITWEASDPNNDALTYALYFRRVGEEPWILLKDKLTEATYDWDTRTAADGRYELKVTASDAASNPPGAGKTATRISDPVLVDNTPPVIGDVKSQQNGNAVKIDLKVVDRTSTVASVDYAVDSNKDWQLVLPTNQIYDSPEETVSFTVKDLSPGQHQVTLRATDSKGNQAFENLFVTVQAPAAAK